MKRPNVLFLVFLDINLLIGAIGLLAAAGLVGAIVLGVTP